MNGIALFVLSIPCVLGFSVWSGFKPFGAGTNIMDLEDFAVNNILLPLGSIIFVIFCTSRFGWGWDKFTAEANEGKGFKVSLNKLIIELLGCIIKAVLQKSGDAAFFMEMSI